MDKIYKYLYDNYVNSGQAGVAHSAVSDTHTRFSSVYPYFKKRILPHVTDNRQARIIDLACGHGKYIYFLKKHGYTNVAGVDISIEQVALAHQLGIDDVYQGTLQEFIQSQEQVISTILLIDIIEHLSLEETFDLLASISKQSTSDCRVIIHVPNAEGIFGMRVRYGDLTHLNAFTPNSIRQLAKASGFNKIKCFEDKPVVHGLKSAIRRMIWMMSTAPFRILLLAETGNGGNVLSQNMLVVLEK